MRISACLSLLLLLVSCAGSPAPRTRYLLRGEPVDRAGRVEAPTRVGLGRVAVAPYLDQAGIVVETAAGQVQAANFHQWAEPLDAGLRSLLHAELSKALGYDVVGHAAGGADWDYRVDIYVDQLHGSMTGTARLDASFRILPGSAAAVATDHRFSRSAPLPREGYPGLVDAEVDLVRQLAQAIAAALGETAD